MLTKQNLLQAKIIGCNHQVAGFSTPCKAIVKIADSATSNTLSINDDSAIIAQQISQIFTDNGVPLQFKNGATPKAKDIFELDEDIAGFDNAQNGNENAESISEFNENSSEDLDTKSNEIFTPLPQRYASNDDMAFSDFIKQQTSTRKIRLLFYGGARKIGDNSAFYYASLNVLRDYQRQYPNDIYEHKFIDSAKTIADIINEQKPNAIASLDLFFHGSKWGLYMYKGSSMSKDLSKDDIQINSLNASLYASKTTDFLSATDTHKEKRTIYDIKFDRFIAQGAYIKNTRL